MPLASPCFLLPKTRPCCFLQNLGAVDPPAKSLTFGWLKGESKKLMSKDPTQYHQRKETEPLLLAVSAQRTGRQQQEQQGIRRSPRRIRGRAELRLQVIRMLAAVAASRLRLQWKTLGFPKSSGLKIQVQSRCTPGLYMFDPRL